MKIFCVGMTDDKDHKLIWIDFIGENLYAILDYIKASYPDMTVVSTAVSNGARIEVVGGKIVKDRGERNEV
jgi:hypothetical protein